VADKKLEFVRDGFGELRRYTVQEVRGKYRVIYLAPEVIRKTEDSRVQAVVEEAGLYYLKRGDIILR
jgi:hypothetical protein